MNEKLEHILNTVMFRDRKQQSFQVFHYIQYFMIGNKILHISCFHSCQDQLFKVKYSVSRLLFLLVIVACLLGISNSGPAHTYKQRQQAAITL